MGWAWALVMWLSSAPGVTVDAASDVPGWARRAWAEDGAALAAALPLRRGVRVVGNFDEGRAGRLDIDGRARAGDVMVWLSGDGWREETVLGRRVLRQNLAHEYVHAFQAEVGEPTWVAEIVYEGIAEALSLHLLTHAGVWEAADAALYAAELRRRCDRAARRGPVRAEAAAGAGDAVYGCGFALVSAALDAAAETDPLVLYAEFAEAVSYPATFGRWVEARLGRDFLLRARTFLRQDFSGAGAGYATRGLGAGRL